MLHQLRISRHLHTFYYPAIHWHHKLSVWSNGKCTIRRFFTTFAKEGVACRLLRSEKCKIFLQLATCETSWLHQRAFGLKWPVTSLLCLSPWVQRKTTSDDKWKTRGKVMLKVLKVSNSLYNSNKLAWPQKVFIADWSNYDIFIGIIDHSPQFGSISENCQWREQVKSGEKYQVLCSTFILIMFIFIKKNLQSFSLIFLSLSKQFATKLILDRIPHWKTKFLIIILRKSIEHWAARNIQLLYYWIIKDKWLVFAAESRL